jgi:hypothetical protein
MSYYRTFIYSLISLLLLLIILIGNNTIVESASEAARWQKVDIPLQGEIGSWLLAKDSDITCLTSDSKNILYAGVSGLPSNLYKSADNGISWQALTNNSDTIIDIVVAPDDDNIIYYATALGIYRSINGTFALLATLPVNPADIDDVITSIDVTKYRDEYLVVIGTKNENDGEFGGIYLISGSAFMQCQDLGLRGFDVYAVSFLPDISGDNRIAAVVTDEVNTLVKCKVGSNEWSSTIGDAVLLKDEGGNPLVVDVSAK